MAYEYPTFQLSGSNQGRPIALSSSSTVIHTATGNDMVTLWAVNTSSSAILLIITYGSSGQTGISNRIFNEFVPAQSSPLVLPSRLVSSGLIISAQLSGVGSGINLHGQVVREVNV